MIVVYTSPGCASCRKVKKWLKDHDLKFIEKNIFTTLLNETEITHLLQRSENGTEDIISKRSKIIQESKIDLDSMSITQLVDFVRKNPSVLKRPIIVDDRRVQVGYNEEEIRTFIPIARRIAEEACKYHLSSSCCCENCSCKDNKCK